MILNMKKIIHFPICLVITIIFTIMITSPINVHATEMKSSEVGDEGCYYTIKIKSGDVATFKNDLGGTLTSDNKTIIFQIEENLPLPQLPTVNDLDINSDHYILDSDIWGFKKNTDKVTRDETIVVQYGTSVSGVEYTVAYQDAFSGKNIAPPKIMRGADGDLIAESYINIKDYKLKSPEKQSISLNQTSPDNNIIFLYDYVGPAPIISYQTETEDVIHKTYVDKIEAASVPQYVSTPVAGTRSNKGGIREVASSLKSNDQEENSEAASLETKQSNVKSNTNNAGPVRFDAERMGIIPAIIAIAMVVIFGLFTIMYRLSKDKKYKLKSALKDQAGEFPLSQ